MGKEAKFLSESAEVLLNKYKKTKTSEWNKLAENFALSLFHETAQRVPAYKDFLRKSKIKPEKITTIEDFKALPIVDKSNYLRAYPLKSLALDGKLDGQYILSSSSGSTGIPFLWPRGIDQEVEGAEFVELFYKYMFDMDKKSTLYIVSFGMGPWIAGTFMSSVTQIISKKGYPIVVLTTGLEKDLLLNLLSELKGSFEQVLIIGYPPFVKDILDSGKDSTVDWKSLNVKLMFAAEGFNEQWRDYVLNKVGAKNPLKSSTNIYGTADAAIMGMETPLSILLKRTLVKNKKIEAFFGQNRQPTIVQYDPTQKYFEKVGEELIFTSKSGLPLIRYNIHDNGDILTYEQVTATLAKNGISSVKEELERYDSEDFDWKIPFLYVFGRSDFMVNFYGLGIFPEHIKSGLEDTRINNLVSGKFNIRTETDRRHNQKLLINIELQKEIEPNKTLTKLVLDSLLLHLKDLNSEFNKLYKELGPRKATPKINLFRYGNEQFKIGAKHKWVKKEQK